MKRLALAALVIFTLAASQIIAAEKSTQTRPNILWISCEDISPNLGCYGDKNAVTPTLDRLARQGVRYTGVFSTAGVCAPTRSGIITGMYPSTLGSNHMRSKATLPDHVKC
ncbi:MAG: sulfatase-like hydrolase/transferase, partial [Planctomycetota bacterium]|nr:sulfatase-like hydrolase/transferase [Planctomycetota bacterium]